MRPSIRSANLLGGRNSTVRVMGRDMEAQPVEVISMETFLARLDCE